MKLLLLPEICKFMQEIKFIQLVSTLTLWLFFRRVILSTIVLFLLICTFLQYIQTKLYFASKCAKILGKFSLCNSSRRIFNIKIHPSSFPALHGIRTLSIFWIVLGHSFTSRIYNPFVNSFEKFKVSIKNKEIIQKSLQIFFINYD